MRDSRVDKWADLIVNYSLRAKPGRKALIVGDNEAMPLIEACYEYLCRAEVVCEAMVKPGGWAEILLENGSDALLETTPPLWEYASQNLDYYLTIGADSNSKLLSRFDPKKLSLLAQAKKPVLNNILGRSADNQMRWVYTHFPTAAAAQDADMGTREYEEFVFSLGLLHQEDPIAGWKELEKRQQSLLEFLQTKKELHFRNASGTDLQVDVDQMKWVNCCGRINFPDGEVYTGPNLHAQNGGVNGVVKYALPTIYRNVEVVDIELIFERGKVVDAKASKGESFLREMIAQDEGASFVGEIALGTNYRMDRVTKNILFDEKFGGTFHLALGKGYPQTGNTNESALHWDMIFDMRNGGSVIADGEIISENGVFTNPEWPQP